MALCKSKTVLAALLLPLLAAGTEAKPYVCQIGPEWRDLHYAKNVVPDSALDFSFMIDAPAGKYGQLKVVGDHFEFAGRPGVRQKFYGTNVCGQANFITHAEADALADTLVRTGYNSIRFHHYDNYILKKDGQGSLDVDPRQQELLDYQFAACKKRGLYVTFDLYSNRKVKPGEFEQFPKGLGTGEYKLAAMLDADVNANFKAFARKILTHVNPYTGMTLANDPAVLFVDGLNENTIFQLYQRCKKNPALRECGEKAFQKYCKDHRLTVSKGNRGEQERAFLYDAYCAYWQDMAKFLKDELKVQSPLTELNFQQDRLAFGLRRQFDLVDDHVYWAHPRYLAPRPQVFPYKFEKRSALASKLYPIRALAPTRILGKPFTVTEINFCFPNACRAEGAAITGAYGAFQDWDAIYNFDFVGGYLSLRQSPMGAFDVYTDPVRWLGERIATAMFLRGDIAPGKTTDQVVYRVRPRDVKPKYPELLPRPVQDAALQHRIGSAEGRTTDVVKEDAPSPSAITSDTGEIKADFNKLTFGAAGSRSEALVLPEGEALNGKRFTAKAVKSFAVCALIDLPQAGRHLVLHLTDVRSEGLTFASPDSDVVTESPRNAKLLGHHGVAEFTVAVPEGRYQLYALDMTGRRLAEIPFRHEEGKVKFTADTFAVPDQVVFAYELLRK